VLRIPPSFARAVAGNFPLSRFLFSHCQCQEQAHLLGFISFPCPPLSPQKSSLEVLFSLHSLQVFHPRESSFPHPSSASTSHPLRACFGWGLLFWLARHPRCFLSPFLCLNHDTSSFFSLSFVSGFLFLGWPLHLLKVRYPLLPRVLPYGS